MKLAISFSPNTPEETQRLNHDFLLIECMKLHNIFEVVKDIVWYYKSSCANDHHHNGDISVSYDM